MFLNRSSWCSDVSAVLEVVTLSCMFLSYSLGCSNVSTPPSILQIVLSRISSNWASHCSVISKILKVRYESCCLLSFSSLCISLHVFLWQHFDKFYNIIMRIIQNIHWMLNLKHHISYMYSYGIFMMKIDRSMFLLIFERRFLLLSKTLFPTVSFSGYCLTKIHRFFWQRHILL